MRSRFCHLVLGFLSLILLSISGISASLASGQEFSAAGPVAADSDAGGDENKSNGKGGNGETAKKPAPPPYAALLKNAQRVDGLIPLHRKESNLFAELMANHYKDEYLVVIAIAKGIGSRPLLGGMTWGFGDDWVWKFRKVDNRVQIIRRNVRFRAKEGNPEARAVELAYSDSVLFSLPIAAKGPKGGDLIDLTPVFMSDLPQISSVLRGFAFSAQKSNWHTVKGFRDNVELQVAATYQSSGSQSFDSVADSRGVTVHIHYSISKLAKNGYQPRLADPRVGYFTTVLKDYSKPTDGDRFVRYINRWKLEKADGSLDVSPPKEPIIFWIEKTVPYKYRPAIRAGIEEWNKAFEKAGFAGAIEVRQQPDDANWDPEDINYNTFRWITASAGFAMGPSRVNPYTGQILDADIIFDADFLQFWKQEFNIMTPKKIAQLTGGPLDLESYREEMQAREPGCRHCSECARAEGMSRQFALGSVALSARTADPKASAEVREKMIMQGLKDTVMHEVGHTLGLRHNFRASAVYNRAHLNDPNKTRKTGLASSVMDYLPTNLASKDERQGDFACDTVGVYDIWAIQYGYMPFSGGTEGEIKELAKIASRSGEPGLYYAPDEDCRGIDPDPLVNRFDLGDDLVAYAKQRAKLVAEVMPEVVNKVTEDGDDYSKARQAFNILISTHGRAMFFAARNVGGLYVSRSHQGDKNAKPPFRLVDVKKQREALALLEEQVLGPKAYEFPPEIYNYLAPNRWYHWGSVMPDRPDFPAHDVISMWQQRILAQLLSSLTLERLWDAELKAPPNQEILSTGELFDRLASAIFAELDSITDQDFTARKPAVASTRRNLQRLYLQELAYLAMRRTTAPADCEALAYSQLVSLQKKIDAVLSGNAKLDRTSQAHLEESTARIGKILDAQVFGTP